MPVGAQAGTNLTTADASHALAISTTAVSRTPLELHDLTAGASQRPRQLGHRADRMALYKMIRRRWTARTLRGALSERDAPLRQADGTGLSNTVADRTRDAASQLARAVRGRPRLETRVEESHRGERSAGLMAAGPGKRERAGLRSSRGSACASDGRRLSAPTHGTSVPLPGSARGC
jgi:hypothetical protein